MSSAVVRVLVIDELVRRLRTWLSWMNDLSQGTDLRSRAAALFLASVVAASCGGSVAGDSAPDPCLVSLEVACARAECPTTLNAEMNRYQSELCTHELQLLEVAVARGCGFAWLAPLALPRRPEVRGAWFLGESGALAGMYTDVDAAGCARGAVVVAGQSAPYKCTEQTFDPCGLCGWSVCEYEACFRQALLCAANPKCEMLWRCAANSGCRGSACLEEPGCIDVVGEGEGTGAALVEALDQMEAMTTCAEVSGCPKCSRSLALTGDSLNGPP